MEEKLTTRQVGHNQEKLVIGLEGKLKAYDEREIDFGQDVTLGPAQKEQEGIHHDVSQRRNMGYQVLRSYRSNNNNNNYSLHIRGMVLLGKHLLADNLHGIHAIIEAAPHLDHTAKCT